jgi:L-serine dehydratase
VLAGLNGWDPETCDIEAFHALRATLADDPVIGWGDSTVGLNPDCVRFLKYSDYRDEVLPHPNTMVCRAMTGDQTVFEQTWCSVGGGFVREADEPVGDIWTPPPSPPRHPFHDCASLVAAASERGGTFGDLVLANEQAWEERPGATADGLDRVWDAFKACISRGLEQRGELPGGLGVVRRAPEMIGRLEAGQVESGYAPVARAQAYAFAVNEENAAGGRVVTGYSRSYRHAGENACQHLRRRDRLPR